MPKRSSICPTALLLTVAFLSSLLVVSVAAAQTARTQEGASSPLVKAPNTESFTAMKKLLIVVQPTGTIQGQVVEDTLAAEMMSAGLTVVSREKSVNTELKLLEETEEKTGSKGQQEPESKEGSGAESKDKSKDKSKSDVGPLGIAKATGADAIVSVTVLTDVVQRNVYDEQFGRITQVKSEQVVLAVSCTVVRVSDGELLAAGCTDYSDKATTIVPAARSLGTSLRGLLR